MQKKIIAIIPARAGSKRVPKKNFRDFCGKPMIAWTIEKLKQCKIIDEIIVSTDSLEIQKISETYGAIAPFLRPEKLSDDFATASAVIKHSLEWYLGNNEMPSLVLSIYPTAILVPAEKINEAVEIIHHTKSKKLLTVLKYSHPIQRAIFKNKNNLSEIFFPENIQKRTQDFQTSYYDAGQFYLTYPQVILNDENLLTNASMLVLSDTEAVDIDTEKDFLRASEIFNSIRSDKLKL